MQHAIRNAGRPGVGGPDEGYLRHDRERPGLGLELKRADAERYAA